MDFGIVTDDRFILEIVAEHLRSLQNDWTPYIDVTTLARMSSVLRVLLVDGAYSHAWRLAKLPKQPTLIAADLYAWFGGIDPTHLHIAQAGGAEYSPVYARSHPNPDARTGIGSHIHGAHAEYIEEVHKAVATAIEQYRDSEYGPSKRRYGLDEYLASPSFIFQGQYVSRRVVIKYVANKLGGTHLDVKRKPHEQEYVLLDMINASIGPLGNPAVFFELLAIGQALARSEDAHTFRSYVEALPARQVD